MASLLLEYCGPLNECPTVAAAPRSQSFKTNRHSFAFGEVPLSILGWSIGGLGGVLFALNALALAG
jgi:hypothetical protein